ncbi:MAG: DUF4783 domain-containing protein [Crocinitomicaceae bacterium]|nr:DUF4783 domain-containing protein [Crocinitomicaceae bacterium]
MSLIFTFLTSVILSLNLNGDVPYDMIEKAFEANDAKAISVMGKSKVLINILGKEGVYSQSQASLVLKDFFTRKPGSSFNFFFKGQESSDGTFAIGSYKSNSGSFRVTIHFKKIDVQFKIESLTIEAS